MATVTGTYTDAAGTPATGTVYLSPCARVGRGLAVITEKRVYDDLDGSGTVSFTVPATDDGEWAQAVAYLVEERLTQLPFRAYYIEVPDDGVDLATVEHGTGVPSGQSTHSHDARYLVRTGTVQTIWAGTQAEYDALTPDPNTLYFVSS